MKNLIQRAGLAAAPLAALALAFLPGLASAQYVIYSGGNYYGSYAPSGYNAYQAMPSPYQYSYGYPSSSYYPYGYQSQSQYQYQSQSQSQYSYGYPSYSYPSYGYSYPSYGYSYPSYSYGYSSPSYGTPCSPYVGGMCGQDQYIGLGAELYQNLIF